MRKVLVFGLFLLGVASMAFAAQRGVVAPSMGHAMAPAPAVGAHAAGAVHGAPVGHGASVHTGTRSASGARVITSHKGTPGKPVLPQPPNSNSNFHPFYPYPTNLLPGISDNFAGGYPAPGLGFDYAHFFAVHPNWGKFHPVDGAVFPWGGGGGFYIPIPYYTASTPEEPEEEQDAANQPPPPYPPAVTEEPPSVPRPRGGSYMSSEPVSEFVFVKHDGSTFSAVAYSWTKDKLQYVTKDGLRRSTGIDSLDLAATERMNQERGNTVNLPKPLASSIALSVEPAPLR